MKIKICGITRAEDAKLAESLGANAVGFILYPKSPRYIEPEHIREITRQLGPFIAKVGVFVNETPEQILAISKQAGLTAVQLHGDETPETCETCEPVSVIKAFRIKEGFDDDILSSYPVQTFLLDTYIADAHGGTGITFDWHIAASIAKKRRILLAGGISPDNATEAIRVVSPWGIDVSSGVESSSGIKDHEALRALFTVVKECGQ